MTGSCDTPFGRLHPLPKLAVCLIWIVASIAIFDVGFQLFVLMTAIAALLLLQRASPLLVLALMVPFALFGFGFFTTSVLFRRESGFAQTMAAEALLAPEAVSAGLVLFLRALACGMVSTLFALSTEPGALVKALMRHARLSPRIGYALFAALNLVPDLIQAAQELRLARAMARGRPPARVPGPREVISLMLPLLATALRRAGRAAVALEARGLQAGRPRTLLAAPDVRWRDGVFVAAALLLLALGASLTIAV